MFSNFKIKTINGEECLFLYICNEQEFSKEFFEKENNNQKKKNIYITVLEFIKNRKIKFNGKKVYLVLNGLLIGTIILHNIINPIEIKQDKFKYVYSSSEYWENINEVVKKEEQQNNEVSQKEEINKKIVETKPKETAPQKEVVLQKETTVTPKKGAIIEKNPTVKVKPQEEVKITLSRYNGTIKQIALEDYVTGVVAAEMPALFHSEALKAQSVVARTYVLKRIAENKIMTDTNIHQAYKDIAQLKIMWGTNFNNYYNKVKTAVASTKGEYVAYNNYYIDALYHSTSNGKTEDPINVWGGSFPYLRSVDSHWDLNAITYKKTETKSFEEVSKILGFNFDEETKVELVSKTTGDRVNKIIIGENTYSGVDIRELFGLRSADFDIDIANDQIHFNTKGYGHGVGMSQYGANGMAKEGYTYKQILNHYYPNTKILIK